MRSDLVDLEVAFEHETERAVLVRGDHGVAWLPLSLVEVQRPAARPLRRGDEVVITAPWDLLTEKGLL